jgi:hypothetical protein
VGVDSEDAFYLSGCGTHNPVAPELKAGARVFNLGQGGDEMCLGYVITAHMDKEGGSSFYTVNLEGFGEKQIEGYCLFPLASDSREEPAPTCATSSTIHLHKIGTLRRST